MSWIEEHIENYHQWLKGRTQTLVDNAGDWALISTPYLGLFNDHIELYACQNNGEILLSDDGETLRNLELSGVDLTSNKSKKRQEILQSILLNYGIKIENESFIIRATPEQFPQKKHALLSALLELNDTYMISKNTAQSVFKEDVRCYLDDIGVIYTPDFISKGATGLEFTFDFQIAHRDREIVIKSFNHVNKSHLSNFLFSWEDIKPVRQKATRRKVEAVAIINDEDKPVNPEYLEALKQKKAGYIRWADRAQHLDLLVAA